MSDSDEVQRALGRIEGSLDGIKTLLQQHLEDDTKRFDIAENRLNDHTKRVRQLEIGSARRAGAAAVIAAVVSAGFTALLTMFKG